jgi:hypothetical protein
MAQASCSGVARRRRADGLIEGNARVSRRFPVHSAAASREYLLRRRIPSVEPTVTLSFEHRAPPAPSHPLSREIDWPARLERMRARLEPRWSRGEIADRDLELERCRLASLHVAAEIEVRSRCG